MGKSVRYVAFIIENIAKYIALPPGVGGGGWGGEGAGGGCVTGVIVVRVFEPVFRNLTHSYIWPLKERTHSYTALWFLYPFIAGS